MNRTATVHIDDQHTVTIQQEFSGKDIFHYFKAKVYATGSLPEIPRKADIQFGDYVQEYRRAQPGMFFLCFFMCPFKFFPYS